MHRWFYLFSEILNPVVSSEENYAQKSDFIHHFLKRKGSQRQDIPPLMWSGFRHPSPPSTSHCNRRTGPFPHVTETLALNTIPTVPSHCQQRWGFPLTHLRNLANSKCLGNTRVFHYNVKRKGKYQELSPTIHQFSSSTSPSNSS